MTVICQVTKCPKQRHYGLTEGPQNENKIEMNLKTSADFHNEQTLFKNITKHVSLNCNRKCMVFQKIQKEKKF